MHGRAAIVAAALAAFLVAVSTASAARSGPAFLVKDINTVKPADRPYQEQPSSYPQGFAVLDGIVYFAAGDDNDGYGEGPNGTELWRSDGTAAGTYLVKDIYPGPGSGGATDLQVHDGALYFLANDGAQGPGLWRSDGTAAGTERLATTGSTGRVAGLTRLGSMWLFLFAGANGNELWRVNADGRGQSIAQLNSNASIFTTSDLAFVAGDNVAYFVANYAEYGAELWRTDGTSAGTAPVADIQPEPASSHVRGLLVIDDSAYFAADENAHGTELWRADVHGATLVADVLPGPESSSPLSLTRLGRDILFTALASLDGDYRLWRSDGTAAGTRAIATLAGPPWSVQPFTPFAGAFYFGAANQLWRTDGSSDGTVLVDTVGEDAADRQLVALADAGDKLLMLLNDGTSGGSHALWRSDGTAAGTTFVRDFRPVTGWDWQALGSGRVAGNGVFVFAADDGNGVELWGSDGTAAGTAEIADLNRGASNMHIAGTPPSMANLNGTLVFTAYDGMTPGIWRSDATNAGTLPIAPIEESYPYYPFSLWPVGERVYFPLAGREAGLELWELASLDGPIRLLSDIFRGTGGSSPSFIASLDGELICAADDGVHGVELWAPYDQGLIADLEPGQLGSYPHASVVVNGTPYFLAGTALWRTDGTPQGTARVADLGDYGAHLIASEDRLAVLTSGHGPPAALWFSDGTAGGTVRVTEFAPVSDPNLAYESLPQALGFAGRTFLFAAGDDAHGVELWGSDGTAAGTRVLADIRPGPGGSYPEASVGRGDALLFFADDGTHGREPWVSDGSTAGTRLLADVQPGPLGSRNRFDGAQIAVGNEFVFAASDGSSGLEPWRSDGTAAGTELLQDIAPDARSSSPNNFTISGEHLYFTANDSEHSRELWAVAVRDVGCTQDCPDPRTPPPTPRRTPRPVWTPGEPLPTFTPSATPTRSVTPHCHQPGDGQDCVFLSIGSASGAPGERLEIGVTLRTGGIEVAGVQLDLQVGGALLPDDGPVFCRVNPAIDKNGSAFAQLFTGGAVRAIIISLENTNPIPDGSLLFTCTYEISPFAAPGTVPIACANFLGSTPAGVAIAPFDVPPELGSIDYGVGELLCSDGAVTVEVVGGSPTPTGTPALSEGDRAISDAGGGGGCHIDRGDTSLPMALLPVIILALWRRRGIASPGQCGNMPAWRNRKRSDRRRSPWRRKAPHLPLTARLSDP